MSIEHRRCRSIVGCALLQFALAIFSIVTVSAQTFSDGVCNGYANEAVKQYEAYTKFHCPVNDHNVWNPSPEHHYRWCKTQRAGTDVLRAGGRLRENQYRDCRAAREAQLLHGCPRAKWRKVGEFNRWYTNEQCRATCGATPGCQNAIDGRRLRDEGLTADGFGCWLCIP